MTISYSIYITEPPSRNLAERVDEEATEAARRQDLYKIDYFMSSMLEDLQDLLPAGYTVTMGFGERED